MGPSVVFFSRGRGRGHAIPDAAIADAVRHIDPTASVVFVSYASGAEALRNRKHTVWDLMLPEAPSTVRVMLEAARVLRAVGPNTMSIVVSHEEFGAIPVCRMIGCRAVLFMADWLPPSETFEARCVNYADEVVVLDEPGHWPVPEALKDRTHFVGRVHGASDPCIHDGDYRQNGVPTIGEQATILVAPGGSRSHSEAVTPMCSLILDAVEMLRGRNIHILWIADEKEQAELLREPRARRQVQCVSPDNHFIERIRAADVVITKGNRITVFEAEALGVPSISVSFEVNPIDDRRVASVRNNISLLRAETTAESLAQYITASLQNNRPVEQQVRSTLSAHSAALRILSYGDRTSRPCREDSDDDSAW